VIEFQQELKLHGESQHVFAMAHLVPWIMMLSKGTVVNVQDQIMIQLKRWGVKNGI
jgi:hypothetical protein